MAGRPRKTTIEYFSHYTNASDVSRTLAILQDRFGNDGYAAWFRLLERLGLSEGHYYDCRDAEYWGFLVAKLHVPEDRATEILDLLAKLGAIDTDLWQSKVIWSQHFVDGLTEVYRKRQQLLPQRPNFCDRNTTTTPISATENTQRIVKDSKGKKRKGYKGAEIPTIELPEWIDEKTWAAYIEMRQSKGKPPTQRALELIASTLTQLHDRGFDANKALEQSIVNNWTDVYEPKGERNNGHKVNQGNPRQLPTRYTRPEDLRLPASSFRERTGGTDTPVPESE